MRTIFDKTLRNMFKPIMMIIYFVVTIFITSLLIISSMKNNTLLVTIPSQIESIKITYSLFVFFWLSGIALIIMIMIFGLDIFATEEYEGTMRILVAKPVSRKSIVLGKILGLLLGSFIYYMGSLLISISIFSLFLRLDKDVFIGLVYMLPSLILYGIFIILLFSSIMSLLSSLFKKKVPSIIILIILILGIYGVLPIARIITIQREIYYESKLYVVDVNSHFGNILMSLIENGKEENELYSETISLFTGRYINSNYDPDMTDSNAYIKKNDYINVSLLSSIYILTSIVLFAFSYRIMTKKDIT